VVTSINGNNVTWRDNKTGELITDPHDDLELIMQKGGKPTRRQNGGNFRPRGLVQRGSGDIDPTSPYGLPVDDVPAILGKNEYVVNANAVKELGEPFLNQLNAIGLNGSSLPRDTGMYGDYQKGGRVRKQQGGRQCIRHRMPDGTIMDGPTHDAGQTCIEWSNGNQTRSNTMRRNARSGYKRGGRTRPVRKQRGGRARPIRRQTGGRGRKRFQQGSHGHEMGHQHTQTYGGSHQHYLPSSTPEWTSNASHAHSQMGVQAFSGSFSSGQAGSHRHAAPYQGGISPTGGGRMRKQRGGRARPIRKQTGGHSHVIDHKHSVTIPNNWELDYPNTDLGLDTFGAQPLGGSNQDQYAPMTRTDDGGEHGGHYGPWAGENVVRSGRGRKGERVRKQTGGRGRPIRRQVGGRARPVRKQTGGRGRPIRRQVGGGGGYVYEATGQPYTGQVVEAGGLFYTTTTGTIEGNSQKVMTLSAYNHNKPG